MFIERSLRCYRGLLPRGSSAEVPRKSRVSARAIRIRGDAMRHTMLNPKQINPLGNCIQFASKRNRRANAVRGIVDKARIGRHFALLRGLCETLGRTIIAQLSWRQRL